VAGHVRGLQVDEVRRNREGVVELGSAQGTVRFRLEVEHGIPRVHLGEPLEPRLATRGEEIGQRRIIGAVAAFAGGVERLSR